MSGYALHPDAFADLDEIWEYIAQDNVEAVDRVLADIRSTLTTLAGSPQIGHRRPDLTTRPLRFHVASATSSSSHSPSPTRPPQRRDQPSSLARMLIISNGPT
jgi:plasmid stabilization system protein ParE